MTALASQMARGLPLYSKDGCAAVSCPVYYCVCSFRSLLPFHPASLVLLLGVDNLPLVPVQSHKAGHGLSMLTVQYCTSGRLPTRQTPTIVLLLLRGKSTDTYPIKARAFQR